MENEKRLVNAEAIARKLKNAHCAECNVVQQIQCSACWVNDVLELLAGDTVDAVEVVRCNGCKQWSRNSGIAESPNGHCFCHDIETNGHDFCSYGERKDNG